MQDPACHSLTPSRHCNGIVAVSGRIVPVKGISSLLIAYGRAIISRKSGGGVSGE
jgi:hypothetical protein